MFTECATCIALVLGEDLLEVAPRAVQRSPGAAAVFLVTATPRRGHSRMMHFNT